MKRIFPRALRIVGALVLLLSHPPEQGVVKEEKKVMETWSPCGQSLTDKYVCFCSI